MGEWTKVVTHPLGLAGFALFLVFWLVALLMKRRRRLPRWLFPAAIAMAIIALVGGLTLAYWQGARPETTAVPQPAPSPGSPQGEQKASVQQETHGDASPAVSNVGGDVTITTTQSPKEKGEEKKEAEKKK